MIPDEKTKMIMELVAARERDAARIRRYETRIEELLSKVDELLSLHKAAVSAEKERDDYKRMYNTLLSKTSALEETLKVRNKNLYGSKSQKGIHKKKREAEEVIPVTRMILIHDGFYFIDNSIAERFVYPLAGERKNSLFFGSDKMARVSALYHTVISTCRMQGVSVLDYFKKFFSEIVKGRRDYEHLLPLTIGLNKQ